MSPQTNQPAPHDRRSHAVQTDAVQTDAVQTDTSQTDTAQTDADWEEARALGRNAGRYFDLHLRRAESRQRERRLSEAAWFGTDRQGGGLAADSYELAKLRSQVKDTGDYLHAIENSVAWRAIQWLRGLFGRAW